jgi:hypothetical protein
MTPPLWRDRLLELAHAATGARIGQRFGCNPNDLVFAILGDTQVNVLYWIV